MSKFERRIVFALFQKDDSLAADAGLFGKFVLG